MKFYRYYLFILQIIIVISIGLPYNVYPFDNREGILIGIGGGTSKTQITFKLDDGTEDTYISNGIAFSARMGWCLNKHAFIYWDMRESAYFDYKPTKNDTYHAGLWSAIGLSLYLNSRPNSLYITGSTGLGDLETDDIGTNAIVGLGISQLIGLGYIISNSFGIEISIMNTKIDKNDRLENDFTANSVRLTVYWQFPI